MEQMEHFPVLLDEAIELLNIKPDGLYVDGTFGRGGHSRKILEKLGENGRLIAFDKDPDAITYAHANIHDARFTIIHDSFANIDIALDAILDNGSVSSVDGILLDLGVSSPQLDNQERGFSFRFDAPLDMRMDNTSGISAGEWINTVGELELGDVLWRYGEERFAKRIAKSIVLERKHSLITTTKQLADIIAAAIPFHNNAGQHKATRSFQAIRIMVNNELADLEKILDKIPALLKPDARLVVISFHSLEDRIVKTKFKQLSLGEQVPKWVMTTAESRPLFKIIAKKIKAGIVETEQNTRSRSAILRALVKLGSTSNGELK